MGGGTYARHFPAAVSFGPEYDAPMPDFVGGAHAANEGAPFDILLQALKIYVVTLLRLEAIDF
jgi:succinyl-diaminopimelate desuccinylase